MIAKYRASKMINLSGGLKIIRVQSFPDGQISVTFDHGRTGSSDVWLDDADLDALIRELTFHRDNRPTAPPGAG